LKFNELVDWPRPPLGHLLASWTRGLEPPTAPRWRSFARLWALVQPNSTRLSRAGRGRSDPVSLSHPLRMLLSVRYRETSHPFDVALLGNESKGACRIHSLATSRNRVASSCESVPGVSRMAGRPFVI
jgi:hypothetical protein